MRRLNGRCVETLEIQDIVNIVGHWRKHIYVLKVRSQTSAESEQQDFLKNVFSSQN